MSQSAFKSVFQMTSVRLAGVMSSLREATKLIGDTAKTRVEVPVQALTATVSRGYTAMVSLQDKVKEFDSKYKFTETVSFYFCDNKAVYYYVLLIDLFVLPFLKKRSYHL